MDIKSAEWRPGPNNTVCRCCLAEGCYKDISTEYFWMGKREVYSEMLQETFDIGISYSQSGGPNSNSRLICEPCISRLRDASEFKRQVQECEKTFMQHLDPVSSASTIAVEVPPVDKVKLETVKLEKSLSDDDFDARYDDDDDDDLDDQPLTKLKMASKVPKKESVDLLDLLDNTSITVKRKSLSKIKAVPAKKAKTKKEVVKATSSKTTAKPVEPPKKKKGLIEETESSLILKDEDGKAIRLKVLKEAIPLDSLEYENEITSTYKEIPKERNERDSVKPKSSKKTTTVTYLKEPISIKWAKEESSVTFNVKTLKRTVTQNQSKKKTDDTDSQWKQTALTIFEFSNVYPFVYHVNQYKCFVCAKPFLNTVGLKEHTGSHSLKELKRELYNKVRSKILKVDVNCLQCKICEKTLPNLENLALHLKEHGKLVEPDLQNSMIPFKLGGDTFECQVCGEIFFKIWLLIIHMSKHFNNFSCEVCGAVFISSTLLKRHHIIHESGNYPCDKCDKVFTNSEKRRQHKRGVHLKRLMRRCPICPERFNSEYVRAKHLRIVHNQSSGTFKCETCGKEFDLKYHLMLHTRSVHLQERNQECGLCHARFFNKNSLSRHMVIHTGEKNFKCEICGKGYTRRKNLREHAKTHELEQTGCTICGQNYEDHAMLVTHASAVHGILLGNNLG